MIVGTVKEIKPDEYRVGIIPAGAGELVRAGHTVLVEHDAGTGSGFLDSEYEAAGAKLVKTASEVFAKADMIVKVKEPQPVECKMLREGQVCFTYFHFAADRELTEGIVASKCVAIAYETVRDRQGRLPLLTPMSEVAGKMSVQEGAKYLERPMMGRGILLGGVPGVEPATVLILGAGIVGTNAAKVAAGLGAHVVLMDVNLERLRYLSDVMPANVQLVFSDAARIREHIAQADLVIGAVLIPGAKCPVLVPRDYLKLMKPGAVIVDVGVDQGGCCETIRPTTHADPTYIVDGVVHYGVANMPGAVGRTSTLALTNATLPYTLRLANMGYKAATAADPGLAEGVDVYRGYVTNEAVAKVFEMEHRPYKA
ncbi:MAG: alanine dehydrogenase [Phycisphaerae bacterium]|nr:MAG: alanine dehydrogenase [Planctomycetia bacterium]GJQ25122.1 MAG: alanine dehydrogenase [Phycisphaerae bacterium]